MTDTIFTVVYATVISFWGKQIFPSTKKVLNWKTKKIKAAVYMGLWKRKQAIYALRWNLQDSELEEQDVRSLKL